MDKRERSHSENEVVFRRINDRIEELAAGPFGEAEGSPTAWEFVCECKNDECAQRIPLTLMEYEAVREDGRCFIVAPDDAHVDPEIETVVDRSTRYWVVEKHGEAGEYAEEHDPRD